MVYWKVWSKSSTFYYQGVCIVARVYCSKYISTNNTDCRILKNKKCVGLAEEQNVRQTFKPSIVEFENYIYMHMYNSTYKIKLKNLQKKVGITIKVQKQVAS